MSTEVPADNNPRAAADRSLTARQAKARIRFLDLWSVIAAIGLLGGIVWLMGILL